MGGGAAKDSWKLVIERCGYPNEFSLVVYFRVIYLYKYFKTNIIWCPNINVPNTVEEKV